MTPKPEECEVCGRVKHWARAAQGAKDVCNGYGECHELGYERRGVEITALRAQLEDCANGHTALAELRAKLQNCAKERDEARGALRAVIAAARAAPDADAAADAVYDIARAALARTTLARAEGPIVKEGT